MIRNPVHFDILYLPYIMFWEYVYIDTLYMVYDVQLCKQELSALCFFSSGGRHKELYISVRSEDSRRDWWQICESVL